MTRLRTIRASAFLFGVPQHPCRRGTARAGLVGLFGYRSCRRAGIPSPRPRVFRLRLIRVADVEHARAALLVVVGIRRQAAARTPTGRCDRLPCSSCSLAPSCTASPDRAPGTRRALRSYRPAWCAAMAGADTPLPPCSLQRLQLRARLLQVARRSGRAAPASATICCCIASNSPFVVAWNSGEAR